jgi:16S rRNA pseudouridine516 synthase
LFLENIMQLERLLRSQGFGSRPECRALIYSGKVFIDGVCCDDPFAEHEPDGCIFTVGGEEWQYRKYVYLMLNKPADFECSHKPKFHPSIYTLLPKPLLTRGVQAVGRLDEDTTGLLLFSDDGQFIHRYTSPKKKIEKKYDVKLKHIVSEQQIAALLDGVKLNDEPEEIQAQSCIKLSDDLLRMGVTEGKYHLVKRMIAAAGNRVENLNRVSVGGLALPDNLPLGEFRWLESADLELLAGEI